jgi:hypothetical protein
MTQRSPKRLEQAIRVFEQSLALAEALGMRPLEAHCHLGSLYAMIGQRERPAPPCPPPSTSTAPWT